MSSDSLLACTLIVGIAGVGLIGKELVAQLNENHSALRTQRGVLIRVVGLASTSRLVLSTTDSTASSSASEPNGAHRPSAVGTEARTSADVVTALSACPSAAVAPRDILSALSRHVLAEALAETASGGGAVVPVLVDCTAGAATAHHILDWMRAGIRIVTCNKQFAAGDAGRFAEAMALVRARQSLYFHEATVGAGMPIISTLKHLRATGDRMRCVQGILSGTLSYLFNSFTARDSWSSLVLAARALGYTEPDPRDDLSGVDVARKVVILARLCGLTNVEMDHVSIESLVPEALRAVSVDEFLSRLHEFDDEMSSRARAAEAAGSVLRFVGCVDLGADGGESGSASCTAGIRLFPVVHPFAQMSGSDNVVEFATSRYSPNPLIIRGQGAGAQVTAAGVFSDLLHIATHSGAPNL